MYTHLFQPNKRTALGRETLPLGSPLRISDTPEWPPPILFDAVYASAVLHHFGTQTLKDEVAATWKDTFDPGGVMAAADANYKVITDERSAAANRAQETGPGTWGTLSSSQCPRRLRHAHDSAIYQSATGRAEGGAEGGRGEGRGDGAETRAGES